MEQENKKGKKKGLIILLLLLLVLAATSVTLLLVDPQKLDIFRTETEIENLSEAEQTLRERLAAEGSDTIEVSDSIEIYGGPLIVNGDKVLSGSGELIAMEGIKEDGLLSVSDGASLEIKEIKLNGNLMVDYILHIAKSGKVVIGDSADITDAADINIYNNGSLAMTGGRLRKGNVGIRNHGTAVIEDGIVALMNRYLIDNREEGTLDIKGGTFSSSEGYGLYNRGDMTVANAEISANKLMGICNLGKAEVKDSLVSQNGYHNIINKSRGKLVIETSDITGSSQSGIHNEEDAYVVIKECMFNTNKLGNLHNRGKAEVYKCSFEDVAYSSVLSDGKSAKTHIEDTSIINTTSTGHGILSTNGCEAKLKNVTFINIAGRAIHNKGGHVKGENIKVDQTGKVAIGNDKYETGAFGTISLKKVEVLTPFVAIINNCDGTFELKDAKLRSTEQTVVRIAAGTMTLEDVAVTGAPAKGTTKFYGVYANGGTLNIKDCSIKNTSSRGIQNHKTKMNIDGLSITNTGAAAMGTVAAKPGETPSTIIANNLTITGAGSNSICNAGDTSKIIVTNSVINPAGGNSVRVLEGVLTMENTKIYGSQKDECVAVKVEKKGTATLSKNTYITNEKGRGVINEGTLRIQDVKIENCKTVSHGGAIYNNANLEVKDSILYNNVSGANGGAIHSSAVSKLTLNGVEMSNNKATGQGGAINLPAGTEEKPGNVIQLTNVTIKHNGVEKYSSGAIYVGKYRQLKVDGADTVISRNSAVTYGGAIGMGDYAVVTFADGIIQNNDSEGGGGAIFLKPSAELTLKNANIRENEAKAHGGAIYVSAKANLVATGTTLAGNVASKNGETYKNGGAIHAEAASLVNLSNVKLNNNIATGQGGAINLPSGAEDIKDNLIKLTNVTIKGNEAENYSSGAIYVGRYRQLEVNGEETLINGNTSGTYGGAIGAGDYSKVTINAGTISENKTSNNNGGGGIFVKPNAVLNMNGGNISQNTASAGGGVYLDETAVLTMTGGKVNSNTAENGNGGGIFSAATATLEISNAELSGNTASVQGGAINLNKAASKEAGTKLTLTDVIMKDNKTSTKSSGAIFVGAYRELEINGVDTLISGNNAKTTGGAIGTADNAVVTMNAGTISGNVANAADGGGAIFLWNATFTMNGGSFSGNVAKKGNGGAIVGAGTSSVITVTGGAISNNEAGGGSGGAIHAVEATEVSLSNVELNGNKASVQGGAISLAAGSKATTKVPTLTDVAIKDNTTSTKSSGAIYVGKYRNLEINGVQTVISGNSSKTTGGAIGTADYAVVTMNAGTISGNVANGAEGGGAIFLWNTKFTMNGGTISGNISKAGYGGSIVGAGPSSIIMNGGTITGNTANATGGGGIYLRDKAVFTMNGGNISANNVKSGQNGENVYINSGTTVKLGENANLASVYFATGNTPIQVLGNTLNNPVTVTCTSANQAGTLVVKKADGATVNLVQLCDSGKIVVGAGFDNTDYALIETEQGMAWTAVAKVTTFAALKSAVENTNNALQYIKVEAPLSVNETVSVQNNANIILFGNATLTRASGFTGEFFNVAAGSTLTLEGVTKDNKLILDGAKSTVTAEKPLIVNSGALNVSEGVVLQNNNNNVTSGGAISTTTSMSVENATLIGNTAKLYGGAIFLDNGTAETPGKVTLTNVTIQGNTASTKAGGAIYVAKNRQLEINGENTVISGNTTGATGGAIGTNAGATVTMNAGILSGNKANGYDGGAVYLWQATFTMNGGKITGNNTGVASKKGCGGAIFVSVGSHIDLSNGEISGNTANYRGGAIYLDSETKLDNLIKFTNVTIKDNKTTTNSAGAVYVGKYRNIEIAGAKTLIGGNVAKTNGGAFVTSEGVNFVMKAGTISENTANGGDGAGGVYCWGPSIFAMSGGTVKDNVDNSGKASPNVRAYYKVTVQLSGNANLASISWQPDNGKTNTNAIQVTGPLTVTNAVTEVTFAGYSEGTKVITYTGTEEVDMATLLSKFSVKDANYKLVSDGKDIKLANQ